MKNLRTLLALLLACALLCGALPALAEEVGAPLPEPVTDLPVPEVEAELPVPDDAAVAAPEAASEEDAEGPGFALDEANFPDAAFRHYLARVDADGNGALSADELEAITSVNVRDMGIASLKGVERLEYLETLDCTGNDLTALDLSDNFWLAAAYCGDNPLTELTLGPANEPLAFISVYDTRVTRLDVSDCDGLIYLSVGGAPLAELDVSHNAELMYLEVAGSKLADLDVTHNPHLKSLYCQETPLSSLDVTQNPELLVLDCSFCPNLDEVDVSRNAKLESLNLVASAVRKIDLTRNTSLRAALKEAERSDGFSTRFGVLEDFDNGVFVLDSPIDRLAFSYGSKVFASGKVIYRLLPDSVSLDREGILELYKGEKLRLSATVEPEEADTALEWRSSNAKVLAVDAEGNVKAKKAGIARVVVRTDNGKSAEVKIRVIVEPTGVALNKKGVQKLKAGKKLQLKATLSPKGATAALTWRSSNPKVAAVSQKGKVTARKPGTATITVATDNGKTAKVKIKVTKK